MQASLPGAAGADESTLLSADLHSIDCGQVLERIRQGCTSGALI